MKSLGLDAVRLRTLGACALAAALALVPFVCPNFLVFQLALMLTYAIAVMGVNLTLGFNGIVSLAQGAFFAVGAYTTAILVTQVGLPWLPALLVGALLAGVVGLVVGLPALRLPGLQLAVLTFGLAALMPQLILKFPQLTKGISGITFDKPVAPGWFPGGQDQWLYAVCLTALAVYVLGLRRLLGGDSGRSLKALRDGPLVAASLGVNATRVRLTAFAISSAMAGLGGGLFAIVNAYVNPDSFQALRSIEFIIAAVVGGLTSIVGAVIGAAFITFVPDWAAGTNVALGGLIYGGTLLVVVLLAPAGVVGLLDRLAQLVDASRPSKLPGTSTPTPPSAETAASAMTTTSPSPAERPQLATKH